MPREVYLHVGPAKSGTTYLQRVAFANRELLAKHGVLYPGDRASHFWPVLDLKGKGFKGHEYPQAVGAWEALASQVRSFEGHTALISHETLARCSQKSIEDAVGSFPDSHVRVLITCRDLGRQIPATWQENVKNRNVSTYTDFLTQVFDSWQDGTSSVRGTFWGAQDLFRLAQRWAKAVGEENVRLVTVPPPGAPPRELWDRFARAAGFPDLDYDFELARGNVSLGVTEVELLRRLNTVMPEDLTWRQYERRIKGRFVNRHLRANNASAKLTVPEQWRASTTQVADEMIGSLRASGFEVVGDLEDLRPSFEAVTAMPDGVGDSELLALALQLLAQVASAPPGRQPAPPPTVRQAAGTLARGVWGKVRRGGDRNHP